MPDLSPRARELLAAAHGADEPRPGDFKRVRRGVLLRVGSAGFGATVFSLCLQRAQAFLGVAAPKLVAVVALAVGGSAVYQHVQSSAPSAAPALLSAPLQLAPKPLPVIAPSAPAPAPVAVNELTTEPLVREARRVPVKRQRAAAAAPSASALEAEMRWVRAADAALRSGDASAAQGLLEDHAREFPNGALAEEREGLRIVAGCQSQSPDGRRQAARFLERAPHSLLAGRVRAACPSLELGSSAVENLASRAERFALAVSDGETDRRRTAHYRAVSFDRSNRPRAAWSSTPHSTRSALIGRDTGSEVGGRRSRLWADFRSSSNGTRKRRTQNCLVKQLKLQITHTRAIALRGNCQS